MKTGKSNASGASAAGFTVLEVVLALAVLSITMGPLLSAFYFFSSSSSSSNHKMAMTVLAEDMLEEIISRELSDPGCPFEFGPEEKEKESGDPKRILFNDIDDYCGYTSGSCPQDMLGNDLPAYTDYQVEVTVTLTCRNGGPFASATTLAVPFVTGETLEFDGVGKPHSLAVSEYGESIYVSLEGTGRVAHVKRAYDEDQDTYRHQVDPAIDIRTGDEPHGVALSPLGNELFVAASAETSGAMCVFPLDEIILGGTTLEVGENPELITCVCPSSNDLFAYVTINDQIDPKEPELKKIDLTGWPPRVIDGETISLTGAPGDLVASPKGDRVFLCVDENGSGKVLCIDPKDSSSVKLSESFKFPLALEVDSRGEVLFVVEQSMVTAYVIPVENQADKYEQIDSKTLWFAGDPSAAARSPDDGFLAASSGSVIAFIDISRIHEKDAGKRKLFTHEDWKIEDVSSGGSLSSLAFSPSGDRLYAASPGDNILYILEDARVSQEIKVYVKDRTNQCREIVLSATVYR